MNPAQRVAFRWKALCQMAKIIGCAVHRSSWSTCRWPHADCISLLLLHCYYSRSKPDLWKYQIQTPWCVYCQSVYAWYLLVSFCTFALRAVTSSWPWLIYSRLAWHGSAPVIMFRGFPDFNMFFSRFLCCCFVGFAKETILFRQLRPYSGVFVPFSTSKGSFRTVLIVEVSPCGSLRGV